MPDIYECDNCGTDLPTEDDIYHITNMVIDANRVLTTGGAGANSSGWYIQSHGQSGGAGAFKSQVIG